MQEDFINKLINCKENNWKVFLNDKCKELIIMYFFIFTKTYNSLPHTYNKHLLNYTQ